MLNWGVMSAGGIAYVFCNAMRFTDSGRICAVAKPNAIAYGSTGQRF